MLSGNPTYQQMCKKYTRERLGYHLFYLPSDVFESSQLNIKLKHKTFFSFYEFLYISSKLRFWGNSWVSKFR